MHCTGRFQIHATHPLLFSSNPSPSKLSISSDPAARPYADKSSHSRRPIAATTINLAPGTHLQNFDLRLIVKPHLFFLFFFFAMVALLGTLPNTSPCSAFLSPPFIHLRASFPNPTCTVSKLSQRPCLSKTTFGSASSSSASSSLPSHSAGLPIVSTTSQKTKLHCHPCPPKCSGHSSHNRPKARPRTHAQLPHAPTYPSQHARITSYHRTDSVPFRVSDASAPRTTTTPTSTTHPSPPSPSNPSVALPVPPPSPDPIAPLPVYQVENRDAWPLYTVVAAPAEEPPVVYPEAVLNAEKLQSPFWRTLTRSGRHMRLLLLGSAALRREASNARKYAYTPYTVALSRGIVIFADYLADLLVLDLVQDGLRHPCPPLAVAAIAAGAASGIAAGDALTGIAAWLSTRYFPSGFFNFFPTSLTQKSNSNQKRDAQKVTNTNISSDIFVQLQNSCFLCTPALTVATSIAHEGAELSMSVLPAAEIASTAVSVSTSGTTTSMTTAMVTAMMIDSMETLTVTLYLQTTIAVTLSLCALAPILRPSPSRPDTAVIRLLRSARLLKQHGDHGWAQTSGVADTVLNIILPVMDNLLVRGRRILKIPEPEK